MDKSEITQQLVGWSLGSLATKALHSGNEAARLTGSGQSSHPLLSVT